MLPKWGGKRQRSAGAPVWEIWEDFADADDFMEVLEDAELLLGLGDDAADEA
jgi:hypothetical protein